MSEGTRPGGLTALAVLNFIFGGFGMLGAIGMAALFVLMRTMKDNPEAENARHEMARAWQEIGMGFFVAMMILNVVTSVLLVVSGIGYMKQKKGLGRGVGNAYALLAIAHNVTTAVLLANSKVGGFTLGTIVALLYPVVTLFLLNVTFKEDFVR